MVIITQLWYSKENIVYSRVYPLQNRYGNCQRKPKRKCPCVVNAGKSIYIIQHTKYKKQLDCRNKLESLPSPSRPVQKRLKDDISTIKMHRICKKCSRQGSSNGMDYICASGHPKTSLGDKTASYRCFSNGVHFKSCSKEKTFREAGKRLLKRVSSWNGSRRDETLSTLDKDTYKLLHDEKNTNNNSNDPLSSSDWQPKSDSFHSVHSSCCSVTPIVKEDHPTLSLLSDSTWDNSFMTSSLYTELCDTDLQSSVDHYEANTFIDTFSDIFDDLFSFGKQ